MSTQHFALRHITRFRYATPVRESVTEVMMQPRADGLQRLTAYSLTTTPRAQVFSYSDHLGNTVQHFNLLQDHDTLVIEAAAQVEMTPPPALPEALPDDAWQALAPARIDSEAFEMLQPSPRVAHSPAVCAFLSALALPAEADPLTLARQIARRIHDAFTYDVAATDVETTVEEAVAHGRGVCQDFSHAMIACARLRGLPARYVSGYLYHRKDLDDRPPPDATHAWVEVLLPDLGWVGFDPTNDVLARERHIRVAVGRDYGDVPPTRGTFKGKAESELGYAVTVQPASQPLRPPAALKVARALDTRLDAPDPESAFFHQQ